MPALSVVIITYNEEKNIKRCLESIKDLADEILVVDSFSTDGTEEICRQYGVRFIQHPFEGYIEQKNYAIAHTQHFHVLSIDADEALNDTLKRSVKAAKQHWEYDGYYMNRLSNYCGKWIRHSGWYPDKKLRLLDKRKGKWAGMNPHDKFEMVPGGKTGHLKGDLLHYSYYSVEEHYKQADKFSTIAAQVLYNKHQTSGWGKIIVKTISKFIRNYILKRGFLDGYYGFTICRIAAWETFHKYYKLKKMGKKKREDGF